MRVFLDTNIVAYQFDNDFPEKQATARRIVQEQARRASISTQVLLELTNVLTRKLKFSKQEVISVLEALDFDVVGADAQLVLRAAQTSASHDLSIYDAMILEAAVRGHCEELWTEDLATGSTLRGVRIVDPFQA